MRVDTDGDGTLVRISSDSRTFVLFPQVKHNLRELYRRPRLAGRRQSLGERVAHEVPGTTAQQHLVRRNEAFLLRCSGCMLLQLDGGMQERFRIRNSAGEYRSQGGRSS